MKYDVIFKYIKVICLHLRIKSLSDKGLIQTFQAV